MPSKKTKRAAVPSTREPLPSVKKIQDPGTLAPTPTGKVKLRTIKPPAAEAGTTGLEPEWPKDKKVETSSLGRALSWYAYVCDRKDARKNLEEWFRGMFPDTADKLIKDLDRVSDGLIPQTAASMARMHLKGFPLTDKQFRDILSAYESVIKIVPDKVLIETETKSIISVQDRILAQVRPTLAEIDHLSDCILDGESIDQDVVETALLNSTYKAPHLALISKHLENSLREWGAAIEAKKNATTDDEQQLADGYRLVTLRQLKKGIDVFSELNDLIKKTSHAVKTPRKRKARSAEQILKRLKYCETFDELNIGSVDPSGILGASTVWVYDTKRRKLGQYVCEFSGSIDVKGTTLLGVNLKASTQKTLRKPELQLAQFMSQRKGQHEKWFGNIKSKSQLLRGRTNVDLVILRTE